MTTVLREPKNNAYGRFRVLVRTDGRFIVHDPDEWPSSSQAFHSEADARAEAFERVMAVNPAYVHPQEDISTDELRSWLASKPHVPWCGCVRCAGPKGSA